MEKLEVNGLQSSKGSISQFMWGGVIFAIVGTVLFSFREPDTSIGQTEIISGSLAYWGGIISYILCGFYWTSFFYYFAEGCKELPNNEYKDYMLLTLTVASMYVCLIFVRCFDLDIFLPIGIIIAVIAVILWYKIGKSFSNNYSGSLSEIGNGMLNVLWKTVILIGLVILYWLSVILFDGSESVVIGGGILVVGYQLWWIYLLFNEVYIPMDRIIENGYFEQE